MVDSGMVEGRVVMPPHNVGDLLIPINDDTRQIPFFTDNLIIVGLARAGPESDVVMGYKVMLPNGEIDWLSATQVSRFHKIPGNENNNI